ncbi:MAG: polyprenyl synthetase family protein [Spirochaetaceae bacterium]
MKAYLEARRRDITAFLDAALAEAETDFARVSPWGADVADRLRSFTLRGKMIRGALVGLGAQVFGAGADEDVVRCGAVVELIQSFLLIHDDIMDRDRERRGEDAVFYQYATLAREEGIEDWYHLGEALGTCVGDVTMLFAFDLLGDLGCTEAIARRVRRLFSREITWVGLAQMSDLYYGETTRDIEESEILDLYRYKTGRYTFSLPLAVGATLAGRGREETSRLEDLGEKLGIIFQIKDDELGLFGDHDRIGKPLGSDIAENKKTLHRKLLFARAAEADRLKLASMFGAHTVSESQVELVRALMEEYGVRQDMERRVASWAEAAETDIESIGALPATDTSLLTELLAYNLERNR